MAHGLAYRSDHFQACTKSQKVAKLLAVSARDRCFFFRFGVCGAHGTPLCRWSKKVRQLREEEVQQGKLVATNERTVRYGHLTYSAPRTSYRAQICRRNSVPPFPIVKTQGYHVARIERRVNEIYEKCCRVWTLPTAFTSRSPHDARFAPR